MHLIFFNFPGDVAEAAATEKVEHDFENLTSDHRFCAWRSQVLVLKSPNQEFSRNFENQKYLSF